MEKKLRALVLASEVMTPTSLVISMILKAETFNRSSSLQVF